MTGPNAIMILKLLDSELIRLKFRRLLNTHLRV